jgi:hypothetical protein
MRKIWALMLAAAMTATATTTAHAFSNGCYWSMCPGQQSISLSAPYVDFNYAMACNWGGNNTNCSGLITFCWSLVKLDFSCNDVVTDTTSSNTVTFGLTGCGSCNPSMGSDLNYFHLPSFPINGDGEYAVRVKIYDGSSCTGTTYITTYSISVNWNGTNWVAGNCF